MPDFTYEAMANTGIRNKGTLTAGSKHEVMSMLDARALSGAHRYRQDRGQQRRRRQAHQVAAHGGILRSAGGFACAGVALLRALQILEKQGSNPALSEILREVHIKVADGTSLADAMALHPGAFPELAVSMVRAGEEGGFIEDVLERIANFTEHQEDLKSKVMGAMAYPLFLAVTGVVILNVLVMFFVPKFEPIFKKLDEKGELPALDENPDRHQPLHAGLLVDRGCRRRGRLYSVPQLGAHR